MADSSMERTRALALAVALTALCGGPPLGARELDDGTRGPHWRFAQVEQPSTDLVERIERTAHPDDDNVRRISDFSSEVILQRNQDLLMRENVPYYYYHALKDDAEYVLHPMALGRFLVDNAKSVKAKDFVQAAIAISHELPNRGLAWYYPKHYRVSRMLGPDYKYSGISQGTILSGMIAMAEANPDISFVPARRTFRAMLWPLRRGGTNFAGRAILEMPSFAGPPENILNGWIDALLHLRDYVEATGDAQAKAFFERNVGFLVTVLPNFDVPAHEISRYSDVSPYRVRVTLSSPQAVDSLAVVYRAKVKGIDDLVIPLRRTEDPDDWSNYDNQIWRQNGRIAHVWLTCSQLFDTELQAKTDALQLEMETGVVDRLRASPGFGGRVVHKRAGADSDGIARVAFGPQDGLICGYPTNFLKSEKYNYYHVYHVVGLMLLALDDFIDPSQRDVLLEYALRWHSYMQEFEDHRDIEFWSPQDVLKRTIRNQHSPRYENFETLLGAARMALEQADN